MKIVLTRVASDRRRFVVGRNGARPQARDLETRSFLGYNLVHLTVERVFGFTAGFYGRLASDIALEPSTLQRPPSRGASPGFSRT
ncbi:MAG: hypothetical protein JNK82_07230 [Myxococcaceae bacterium]|nr:hypothetical protein [Myxococcaceae bacterium]